MCLFLKAYFKLDPLFENQAENNQNNWFHSYALLGLWGICCCLTEYGIWNRRDWSPLNTNTE